MAISQFKTNPRMIRKLKIFNERRFIGSDVTMCELCRKVPATDLHEVVNRVHYPPDMLNEVPDVLLACLCNQCNVNLADQQWARRHLVRQNILRYGIYKFRKDLEEFSKKLRAFDPDIVLADMIDTE